jgi:hypothetical protein
MSLPALFIPLPSPEPPPVPLPSEDDELNELIDGGCYPPQKRKEDGVSTICYDTWLTKLVEGAQQTFYRARRAKVAFPNVLFFKSAGAGILELLATKTLTKMFDPVDSIVEHVVMIDTGANEQMAAEVVDMFESEFELDLHRSIRVDYFHGPDAYLYAKVALERLPLKLLVSGAINEGSFYSGDIVSFLSKEADFWNKLSSIPGNSIVPYVSAFVSSEDHAESTFTLDVSTVAAVAASVTSRKNVWEEMLKK